jgi:xanthine dehydrogenase accessory factor
MATTEGDFFGAVSGGCVESDVRERAAELMRTGRARMLHYDQVEDGDIDIGLNCEGAIDVLLEPLTPQLDRFLRPATTRINLTVCDPRKHEDPQPRHGWIDSTGLHALESPDTNAFPVALDANRLETLRTATGAETHALGDGRILLSEPVLPARRLLIFGAHDIAVPLTRIGSILGFFTVVSDPRSDYAQESRFPDADQVMVGWPHQVLEQLQPDARSAIVSLNHEPRFEDDLFHSLLSYPRPFYLGAIGKPRRHEERMDRAVTAGVDLEQLPKIHTPVGLDLGGKEPEDIALSILAEIRAVENGRSGESLAQRRPTVDRAASFRAADLSTGDRR